MSTIFPSSSVISKIILSGPVSVGWTVSLIIINWVSDAELPEVSVAVHVTIVSPSGNDSGASFSTNSISTASDTLASDNSR